MFELVKVYPTDIRAIRPKAYAVLRKAGVEIAHSYPSRIRGLKNWSRGVVLQDRLSRIEVVSHYGIRASSERDVAEAVAVLRAAGWTVSDDGRIEAMPEAPIKRNRKES